MWEEQKNRLAEQAAGRFFLWSRRTFIGYYAMSESIFIWYPAKPYILLLRYGS